MHYVDEGQGPVVLLLHGNPTWSFYYRELIKGLRDNYRVIAVDHVGCGLSDKPRSYPYTLATHIENLTRLIDHLGLDSVTLGVHDWGGPIGLGWAMKHLDRLSRLVIFNTAAFHGGEVPLRIRLCGWPVLGDFAVRTLNAFARAATFMATGKGTVLPRDVRRGYLFPYGGYRSRVAVLRFVRDIPQNVAHPSWKVIEEIESALPALADRPAIVFWGARDFCFNDDYLEQWRTRLPEATFHRFADAGHYVVEDAHQRILPLLRRFMAAGH
jgi:haloalkane dehalogenase